MQFESGVPRIGATAIDDADPADSPERHPPSADPALRVLLVEPAAGPRALATLMLHSHGPAWVVRDAGTPLDFAECLAEGAFDVLLIAADPGWAPAPEIAAAARRRVSGCLCLLFGPSPPARLAADCRTGGLDGWVPQDPQGFMDLPGRLQALWQSRRDGDARGMSAALAREIPLAWFALDAAGTLTYANAACRRLLGGAADAPVVGTPLADHLDDRSGSAWQLLLGRGAGTATLGLRRWLGPVTSVRVRILPTPGDPAGDGLEGCLETLTEAAGDAGRARQTLADVAYALAHDLQEPLRHAGQFAGLLRDHLGGRLDPDGERLLTRVTDSVARVQDLNDGVVEYLLADGSSAGAATDLRAVVDAAIGALSDSLEEAGGQVTRGTLPMVTGDPARLASVFRNLIANSLRYRGTEPPVIGISARREPGGWAVAVADNGIGIEPRDHERIFGMFQRLHRDSGHGNGNGIGLALCRRLLESMGGWITVDSAAGRGATFVLHFPDPARATAMTATTDRPSADSLRR